MDVSKVQLLRHQYFIFIIMTLSIAYDDDTKVRITQRLSQRVDNNTIKQNLEITQNN